MGTYFEALLTHKKAKTRIESEREVTASHGIRLVNVCKRDHLQRHDGTVGST